MLIDYIIILIYLNFIFILGFILFYLSWFFSNKILGRRRFSIYECGFRSFGGNYKPITIQYYILALIFLLFDIELLYLFPWIITINKCIFQISFLSFWIFSFLLLIGYLYEILKGSLKWYDNASQNTLKKKIKKLRYINK